MGFTIRPLDLRDLHRGLLECLSGLTDADGGPAGLWKQSVGRVRYGIETFVAVTPENRIVGTVSVSLEPKLTHLGKYESPMAARIEDLVVHEDWRLRGVARELIKKAKRYAAKKGCYKIDLSCDEAMLPFYEKQGFNYIGFSMRCDLCSSPT